MLKMMKSVASGLLYMHTRPQPVIHRDIKPDNVLVTTTYSCKITDLGASRRMEHTDLATMTQIGTDMYISPEVIRGLRYDASVDIYSLGIMLVAVHTRKKPYTMRAGRTHLSMLIVKGLRPSIPEDMPPRLVALAQDCWQKDMTLRPGAAEVVERLKQVEDEIEIGGDGGGADFL